MTDTRRRGLSLIIRHGRENPTQVDSEAFTQVAADLLNRNFIKNQNRRSAIFPALQARLVTSVLMDALSPIPGKGSFVVGGTVPRPTPNNDPQRKTFYATVTP